MARFAEEVICDVWSRYGPRNVDGSQQPATHLLDDQQICDSINAAFLGTYGGSWFCIAGPHAVFPELPRPPSFIYFELYGGLLTGHQKYRIFIYSYTKTADIRQMQKSPRFNLNTREPSLNTPF
uniref:Uncharacterized protein n=1 Tax=Acrobeloides nanus TaxID=290746 RepID=A0A914EMB2_9BILA